MELTKLRLQFDEIIGYNNREFNDILWAWVKRNTSNISNLVEPEVKPACEKDIRIDELNRLQQTLNPYQMNENDFFRAMMDGTIKNTILMRINELSKSV